MADERLTEMLYRKLEQTRRLAAGVNDQITTERLTELINDLEEQIAAAERNNTDAPPD